jgi:hypothetical protein
MIDRQFIVASLGCIMAGCVSSGTKVTADQQAAFQSGTTTEAQIIAKLGQPNNIATLSDGSKMDSYTHIAASANAINYVPIVGLFAGGAKSTTDSVMFTFDPQGILKSTTSNHGQSNVNTGLANQR